MFLSTTSRTLTRFVTSNVTARSNTLAPACVGATRNLNLHEYQSAQIMASAGVTVPFGIPAQSVEEAVAAADRIGDDEVVIKSQILAGGRGLGKFTNGLQGGVHVVKKSEVGDYARKMLGGILVTKQTGPVGKPVNTVLIAKKMQLKKEMYFSIIMDRTTQGPLIIACEEGGTSIEDLAESSPEKIIKVPIDLVDGLTDADVEKVISGLGVSGDREAAGDQIRALYKLFVEKDCEMVEVNPLAEDYEGNLVAADAKVGFDENAEFRQKDTFQLRDPTQEDLRDVEASKYNLNYVGLDGSIGCMVNGAGLAMGTMDIIKIKGGSPANFLDVGGSATSEQITSAFRLITSDSHVKAILVNIFGGIMKCDTIAEGVIEASKTLRLKIPVVVRLEGTNVERGKQLLNESGLALIPADDLDDAAEKAVAAVS